jgi:hypothetical protein
MAVPTVPLIRRQSTKRAIVFPSAEVAALQYQHRRHRPLPPRSVDMLILPILARSLEETERSRSAVSPRPVVASFVAVFGLSVRGSGRLKLAENSPRSSRTLSTVPPFPFPPHPLFFGVRHP